MCVDVPRTASLSLALLAICSGCASDVSGAEGGTETGVDRVVDVDATPETGDVFADVSSAGDADSSCGIDAAYVPATQCDGTGRSGCQFSAQVQASRIQDGGVGFATCVPAGGTLGTVCIGLTTCTGADLSTCLCGAERYCGPDRVCFASSPDAAPSCVCLPH